MDQTNANTRNSRCIAQKSLGLFHLKMGRGRMKYANFRDPPIQKMAYFRTPLYKNRIFKSPLLKKWYCPDPPYKKMAFKTP